MKSSSLAVGASRATGGAAYRSWVLCLFLLVATFGFLDRQVIAALNQPIKQELGISDAELGLLGGLAFSVLYVLLSIPVARLAERRHRIGIIAAGIALWSIATMLCGAAGGFVQLALARIGVGVGEAAGGPATASVIADYTPPARRGAANAIYSLAVPLGAFLGAAGGGLVAQRYGWRAAFLGAGAPGILLALLVFLTIREPERGRYDDPALARAPVPPLSAVLRRMGTLRSLFHMVAGATVASAAGFGIKYFAAAYFNRRFGLGVAQTGVISGLIDSVPGMISMMLGGFVADWAGRRDARFYAWIPALGLTLTAPLYILSFLQREWGPTMALQMLTATMAYAYIPATAAMVQNLMEPRMRASAAAVTLVLYSLIGGGLGPLLVGWLSDRLTRASFAGDYPAACAGRAAGDACAAASATGLQYALGLTALIYLWAALHYWRSARSLRADLGR